MSESTGFLASIRRMFRRIFVRLGLAIDNATDSDEFNEAMVQRGINEATEKAKKAHYANGQLQSQIILLKEQIRRQERSVEELQAMAEIAAKQNDVANGASYCEQLADLTKDVEDNKTQLKGLEETYTQNTSIIAESLREAQRFQAEFERVKAKVKVSRSLESLADLIKNSVTELQGVSGDAGKSMERLRQAAAQGQGQMTATMDLAKQVGAGIAQRQQARQAHGKALFEEMQRKMGLSAPVAAPAAQAGQSEAPAKQKISQS